MSNQDEIKNDNKELDTTDESKNTSPEQDIEIIYKKEKNPILKFLLGFVIFLVIAYFTLFITGFIMGWMGIHPPTIDNNVFVNQWEKATGNEQNEQNEPSSELETKPSEEKNNS